MLYDLSDPLDKEKFKARCNHLFMKQCKIELTEKKERNFSEDELRSIRQNNTIHMWFAVTADEIGYISKNECKIDVKRIILGQKPHTNAITGKLEYVDYKTSEMTISELRSFMEKMKVWAQQELGCYLPFYGDPGYEEMSKQYKNK